MRTNTIGLDDDGDDVEVVVQLEGAFSVGISDSEAAACWTVGDLYDLLGRKIADERAAVRCGTAMAFYRLRRTLRALGVQGRLEPATPVAVLASVPSRVLFRDLRRSTGLHAPDGRLTWIGRIGVLLIAAALLMSVLAVAVVPQLLLWSPLTFATGWLLVRRDPRRMPADCRTLGDLARRLAALNFIRLRDEGARVRDRDLWDALVEVLMRFGSITPRSAITRETRLLHEAPSPAPGA